MVDQVDVLNKMEEIVKQMRIRKKKKFPPFQNGILISVHLLINLRIDCDSYNELKSKLKYINTKGLTKDTLDSIFSKIHGTGSQYTHPLPIAF